MTRRYALASAAALACFTSLAQAEDNSPRYTQCMDKASSTVAMSSCIQAETKQQDVRLNQVYKQLMVTLEGAQRKNLTAVQRTWILYRDGNCAFHAQASGGTLAAINSGMCVMSMTRDRAAELERVLKPEQ